jgi:hypothetical protein
MSTGIQLFLFAAFRRASQMARARLPRGGDRMLGSISGRLSRRSARADQVEVARTMSNSRTSVNSYSPQGFHARSDLATAEDAEKVLLWNQMGRQTKTEAF